MTGELRAHGRKLKVMTKVVMKEAKTGVGPGETVVKLPPNNARSGVIFCNDKRCR